MNKDKKYISCVLDYFKAKRFEQLPTINTEKAMQRAETKRIKRMFYVLMSTVLILY